MEQHGKENPVDVIAFTLERPRVRLVAIWRVERDETNQARAELATLVADMPVDLRESTADGQTEFQVLISHSTTIYDSDLEAMDLMEPLAGMAKARKGSSLSVNVEIIGLLHKRRGGG